MNERDAFDRILVSLHKATRDDCHWLAASALIDEHCGTIGNSLLHADGDSGENLRIFLVRFVCRGRRNVDFERDYLNIYHAYDESLPRLRRLPDSQLVHTTELFTREEKKTSVMYNQVLVRSQSRNGVNARLDGPNGSRIVWGVGNPVDRDGWSSTRTRRVRRLLPHIRHFVTIRHALAEAGALGASLAGLLQQNGTGIMQLDRRGRIVAATDRALHLLRRGNCLLDRDSFLQARSAHDNAVLQQLLARALPSNVAPGVGGSMAVRGSGVVPRLVLHVSPVSQGDEDTGAYHVAALVLVAEPAGPMRIDPALVRTTLGLTPTESRVAALLAGGSTVRDMATRMKRSENTIRWHLRHIYDKHGISREVELVRLVLSVSRAPGNASGH